MQNDQIKLSIELDTAQTTFSKGDQVSGKLILQTKQDLNFVRLSICFACHQRGKFISEVDVHQLLDLKRNFKAEAGQIYTFPFQLKTPSGSSFVGQNLELLWALQASAQLQIDDFNKIVPSKLFRSKPYQDITHFLPIKLTQTGGKYEVIPTEGKVVASLGVTIFIVIFCLIFGYICIFHGNGILASGVGLMMFAIGIYFGYVSLVDFLNLKNIRALISSTDEGIKVTFNGNHEVIVLNQYLIGYDIVEKVIDNRGTSTTTITRNLYKYTHNKPINVAVGSGTLIFPFPTTDMPPTIGRKGQGFSWYLWVVKKNSKGQASGAVNVVPFEVRLISS